MLKPVSTPSSSCTLREILQQPELWLTTEHAIRVSNRVASQMDGKRILLTGAGTSAYAAQAIAAAWSAAVAVPTTDLLLELDRYLTDVDTVISLARSGDSPESVAIASQIRGKFPHLRQVAIVCNHEGALVRAGVDQVIFLDPRCNDRSLVMTSSFTNLVLAGLLIARPEFGSSVPDLCGFARNLIPEIDSACRRIARKVRSRLVVLASSPLSGWAREAGLKCLEMCAGRFSVLSETFLGLRHGPMSFLQEDTVVIALLSSDAMRRAYEMDLVHELRRKRIGHLVGITAGTAADGIFDDLLPAAAPDIDDCLRTPFESIGPQMLGFYLSTGLGLNPDEPSPDGIINRVVEEFKIHEPDTTAR